MSSIVISCVNEPEDPIISADYFSSAGFWMRRRISGMASLGEHLATKVIRQWLVAGNRDVNNYQWRVVL